MPSSLRQISPEKEAGMIRLSVPLRFPLVLLFISHLKSYWQLIMHLARALLQHLPESPCQGESGHLSSELINFFDIGLGEKVSPVADTPPHKRGWF